MGVYLKNWTIAELKDFLTTSTVTDLFDHISDDLVEVETPHGNLKDEDYILKEMEYYAVDYYDVYVRHAPTIIESEE